jgi:hypothetical protein
MGLNARRLFHRINGQVVEALPIEKTIDLLRRYNNKQEFKCDFELAIE